MANKIDSNVTGLSYAPEASLKTLPGSPVWTALEPNSYSDFGGEVSTVARNPINASRQRSKGVLVDLDASGGFNTDLTPDNMQDLLQGFMFAAMRTKAELAVATVDTTIDDYQPASGGASYVAGDLLFAKKFDDAANNGLKTVTGVPSASSVPVTANLVTAASQSGIISKVGHIGAAGEFDISVSGAIPTLTSSGFDLTTLGLVSGEWIYIGGDAAGEKFTNAVNNGWKRVKSIAAGSIVIDKSFTTMVTEASTTETVHIYIGRALKNESDPSLIVRTTYQLERTLGADPVSGTMSEYVVGAVPNEFNIAIPTADKVTADLTFVGMDVEQRDGPTGVKSGTRVTAAAVGDTTAFNTSSNIPRIKLNVFSATDANPTALFAYATELNLNINNNVSPNKAIGTLGAFDATAGQFIVSGNMTVYFNDVDAVTAIRNNSDITLSAHLVTTTQKGMVFDVPLITLGDGRPNVEQDEPITLPLSVDAARGSSIDANQDHTLLINFFDYLPAAALV